MSKGSIRVGWSRRERPPGFGRPLGLFNLSRLDDGGGRNITVGRLTLDRRDLEPLRERGLRLNVTVVGMLRLSDDVSPALANAVLKARVVGWVAADPRTKATLNGS